MSDAMSDKHPYADLADEAKALPAGQPGGRAMPLGVPK